MTRPLIKFLGRLRREEDGVAMLEFAFSLILIVPLVMMGVELANYAVVKMRVSQMAVHVADNASRIGTESLLAKPKISEWQINDLFVGANMQGGALDLLANGRVILSGIEPIASPNPTDRHMIRWQRCYGSKVWPSSYGRTGDTNLEGVGPAGRRVRAPNDSGVMFVEIAYTYEPLFSESILPTINISSTAAMVVRDQRDFPGPLVGGKRVGIYNVENEPVSSCPA